MLKNTQIVAYILIGFVTLLVLAQVMPALFTLSSILTIGMLMVDVVVLWFLVQRELGNTIPCF
jgi:hypothetical protein